MAAGLSDFNSAAQLREIIRMYSAEVVSEDRPAVRFATVTAVHATLRQATCIYPGEVATFTIPYGSAQPIVGSMVRVAGRQGGKYIEDVIPTGVSDVTSVPLGGSIFHRINGKDILTITNPADVASVPWVMRMHPTFSNYTAMMRGTQAGSEYIVISNGSDTILGSGTGGSATIRSGNNDAANQVVAGPSGVAVSGAFSTNSTCSFQGGVVYTNSTGLGSTGVLAASGIVSGSQCRGTSYVYANNTRISMGPWVSGNGWSSVEGNAGYFLCDNTGSGANAYIRAYGRLNIGSGTGPNDGIVFENTVISAIGCTSYFQGNMVWGTAEASSVHWPDNAVRAGSGGTQGCMTMWASGIAPQLRVGTQAQEVYVRAADGEHIISWNSAAFSTASSAKYKQDVVDWPMDKAMALSSDVHEEVLDPISIIRQVRPVFYRRNRDSWLSQLPLQPRRALALARLNKMKDSKGEARYHSDELVHDCGRDPCKGTADHPCARVQDWESGNIGFIAEELDQIVPQMISTNHENGQRESVDLMQIASLAVAACKSQQEIIDKLLERVDALEAQLTS
jgi:hypothetical protein